MKKISTIYVIYNPYDNGYYNGKHFGGILFAKKYSFKENAEVDISNILNTSNGVTYLEIKEMYTNFYTPDLV